MLILTLFVGVLFLLPRLLQPWENLFGRFPDSILLLASIGNIARDKWLLIAPILVGLLCADLWLCRMLYRHIGPVAVYVWSVLVTTSLLALSFWAIYVLSDPRVYSTIH